ncbi:AMP-binding protein [Paenibacillus sp. PL2-23]|uniref:phenylacetate--CoA ligase family protein n=1 Tax=Paenibacillus sp. PL2-23 TaxID=2100729 RepID=UPI0030FB63BA
MDGLESKFQSLMARLAQSPLYREKLTAEQFAGASLSQLRELPLTTKDDLRRAGTFGHLAVERKRIAQYHESTGTTGEPSASWFTAEDMVAGGQQLAACGVKLNADDLVLIRFPYALALPAFLMQQAAWQCGAGVVPASGRTVVTSYPRVLELLERLRVTVIAGLPREMELLAETARLLGAQPSAAYPSLRAICVAGELMGESRRRHIERLWGVPVFNMYGSTETGNIAVMCEFGSMHVSQEDFIVESLIEDGSAPAPAGERGFAAITTLSHQGSPLLRYFNGDILTLEPPGCPCGRHTAKLKHYGRGRDRIRIGAIVLDGYDLQEAVYTIAPAPDAWLAIELEHGLQIVLDSHASDQWEADVLERTLSSKLRVPVTVTISSDARLMDRDALVLNVPSTKPVYIQKRQREEGSL